MNDIRFVVSPRIMGEEKFFGPGIAVLLHRVEEYHSIRQATLSMGMAYSKAWTIIRRAERELGFPLLNTTTGGSEGGAMFTNTWQIIGSESANLGAMMAGMAGAMGGGEASAAAGAGMMDMTAMMNINLMYFMMAVFVCLFTAEDFRSGYAKNLFTVRARKTDYVASKTIIGFIAGALFLIAFFIGGVVGGSVAGLSFALGAAGVSGLVMCMLAKIFLTAVFVAIFLLMSVIAKSRSWMSICLSLFGGMLLLYDDSHDDAAGFRRDECGSVPGRRRDLRRSHRRRQQSGAEKGEPCLITGSSQTHFDSKIIW